MACSDKIQHRWWHQKSSLQVCRPLFKEHPYWAKKNKKIVLLEKNNNKQFFDAEWCKAARPAKDVLVSEKRYKKVQYWDWRLLPLNRTSAHTKTPQYQQWSIFFVKTSTYPNTATLTKSGIKHSTRHDEGAISTEIYIMRKEKLWYGLYRCYTTQGSYYSCP